VPRVAGSNPVSHPGFQKLQVFLGLFLFTVFGSRLSVVRYPLSVIRYPLSVFGFEVY
jgi:hypothetical protein